MGGTVGLDSAPDGDGVGDGVAAKAGAIIAKVIEAATGNRAVRTTVMCCLIVLPPPAQLQYAQQRALLP